MASLDVDQGEHKGGEGESAQTQRSRVGDLAIGGRPVETWLELTTESWEARRVTSVEVCQRVAAIAAVSGSCCVDAVGSSSVVIDGSAVVNLLVDWDSVRAGSGGCHC